MHGFIHSLFLCDKDIKNSSSYFKTSHSIWVTMVTILCDRMPGLFLLCNWNYVDFVHIEQSLPILSPPPSPGSVHHLLSGLWLQNLRCKVLFLMWMRNENKWAMLAQPESKKHGRWTGPWCYWTLISPSEVWCLLPLALSRKLWLFIHMRHPWTFHRWPSSKSLQVVWRSWE